MKKITITLAALLIFATSCKQAEDKAKDETTVTTETTTTVVEEETAPVPAMDSAAVEKAWNDYMTPGEMHKSLAMDNGTWNQEMTMWMTPDAPPTKHKMTAVSKMILGGRYQETVHTGNFEGMPFEGKSLVGFDNASQKMVSSWVDNMSTGMMHMTGTYDESTKTIEFKGTITDPVTKKEKPVRELFTMVDDNTRKMQMFDVTPEGKEYKSMEIIMTRKK